MNTFTDRQTAQIIPFPAGGARNLLRRPDIVDQKAAAEMARYADLASGGCWYHEEALHDPAGPKAN